MRSVLARGGFATMRGEGAPPTSTNMVRSSGPLCQLRPPRNHPGPGQAKTPLSRLPQVKSGSPPGAPKHRSSPCRTCRGCRSAQCVPGTPPLSSGGEEHLRSLRESDPPDGGRHLVLFVAPCCFAFEPLVSSLELVSHRPTGPQLPCTFSHF
ncbi:hypothetical protein NDU88_006725 [Pleurodeles waltl]|uniref:Uncharacterized protein n=1 Tax=Pleurodeles waltl TaxID=8319 RepID=A0AAV7WGG4_PLEWA|nr:hypothetical protein NDU88_006725 [Pleurodeles waltl]